MTVERKLTRAGGSGYNDDRRNQAANLLARALGTLGVAATPTEIALSRHTLTMQLLIVIEAFPSGLPADKTTLGAQRAAERALSYHLERTSTAEMRLSRHEGRPPVILGAALIAMHMKITDVVHKDVGQAQLAVPIPACQP